MTQHHESSPWRRPRRWLPLLILVLALTGFLVVQAISRSRAKHLVHGIRARNLPATPMELDAWYRKVPSSDNAALLYLDAYKEHVGPAKAADPDESKEQMKPGEPLSARLAQAIADYVNKNGAALQIIDEATELGASRYPLDLSRGFATLLPHLAQVKEMAQLLKWAAIHKSAAGERDEAVKLLQSGFALAASLDQEPIFISQLVRIANYSILLVAVERVVNDHLLTEAQFLSLQTALLKAEENGRDAMIRGFVGERAIGIPAFSMGHREFAALASLAPSDYDLEDMFKITVFGLRRAAGMHDSDLRFYVENMNGLERALKMDYSRMLPAVAELNETVQREISDHRWRYMVSRLLIPAMTTAPQKQARLAARLRCARMALAIERCRLRQGGKLPSLDQLVPEFIEALPVDPIDNSALEYRLGEGKGYRIVVPASSEVANEGRRATNRQDVAFSVLR